MRRAFTMLGMGTAVFFAAASLTLLPNGTQASSTQATFMVPAADGYGVAECLISNQACGQVVADTWCEAQGYAKAVSFRQISPRSHGQHPEGLAGPKDAAGLGYLLDEIDIRRTSMVRAVFRTARFRSASRGPTILLCYQNRGTSSGSARASSATRRPSRICS